MQLYFDFSGYSDMAVGLGLMMGFRFMENFNHPYISRAVTEFWTRLGSDEKLYAKYKAIDPAKLTPEQRQAHKNALRNFTLSGAELQGADRERFAALQERQAELSQKFSENALDATDAFSYFAPSMRVGFMARCEQYN